MLDDQQGDTKLGISAFEPVDNAVDQGRVDAGRRLVQQQHPGLVHQRHAEFQQLLLAERKIPRQQSALGVKAHELENGICLFLNLGRKTGEHLGQSLTGMRHADLHILDAGHLAVDACLLKGS